MHAYRIAIFSVATALALVAPGESRASTCFAGDPVIAKPVTGVGTNQFTVQIPVSPLLSAANHWLLVDDFEEPNDGNVRTGYYNTSIAGPKSELFAVVTGDYAVDPGLQFGSCTIKAHMLVNGPGTTTVNLVVKEGAVQSDGAPITVDANYLKEYERVMPVNPVTSQPWTSDDVLGSGGGTIIGIKNNAAPFGIGVGFADIALVCR